MFKFPFKRHNKNNHLDRHEKNSAATTLSNEGFVFIRCKHNNNNNNNINIDHNKDTASHIITDSSNHNSYDHVNNKSTVQSSWRPQLPLPKENPAYNETVQRFHGDQNHEDIDVIGEINEHDMDRLHCRHKDNKKHHVTTNKRNPSTALNASSGSNSSKKWSFGRLFRRKKEIEMTDSSTEDDDRNAGFSPSRKHIRSGVSAIKSKRRNHTLNSINYDHNIDESNFSNKTYPPGDNELFLPLEIVPPLPSKENYYQNHHDQHEQQSHQEPKVLGSSTDDELASLNSATYLKYRSDESLQSGSQIMNNNNSQSRRSRAARNERYYKRLSRDSEISHGQAPVQYVNQSIQRWKTQPVTLSVYQPYRQENSSNSKYPFPFQNATQLRSSGGSIQHIVPYVQWSQLQQQQRQQPINSLQNPVNGTKRSVSYDSQIHLQNISGKKQLKVLPPPPPPRDPLRRVQVNRTSSQNTSYNDLRPTSYAFDQLGVPVMPSNTRLTGRCVSDDKIWAQAEPHYQSIHSLNVSDQKNPQQNSNFPTKAQNEITKEKSLANGLDYQYIADAAPRSRKPIHMLEPDKSIPEKMVNESPPPSSGILRTTKSGLPESPPNKLKASQFWKSLDEKVTHKMQQLSPNRGRNIVRSIGNDGNKPRSISSSRILELGSYSTPMYAEVYKPKQRRQNFIKPSTPSKQSSDEVDNIVFGTLSIKPSTTNQRDSVKSNSLGNHYKRLSGGDANFAKINCIDPSYETKPYQCSPRSIETQPIQRGIENSSFRVGSRKKPTNLEETINELEAIYHSLGLANESEEKATLPSAKDFEKFALAHADDYDEEDSPAGEPDPIKDDVAYRNIKLANLQHKTIDKQPPFGIPLRPIVPALRSDYLHSPNGKVDSCDLHHIITTSPDVIRDDLAVRTLRKEAPLCTVSKENVHASDTLNKKNRATRTQSANIYALMKDAAKPSGGDALCYTHFTHALCLDRTNSLSDICNNDNVANDVPSTLKLLQSLREQDNDEPLKVKKLCIPFRHPNQGGAICQLPEVLSTTSKEDKTKPTPLPRKSITPEPRLVGNRSSRMEEALNKIAQDAQESSIKLSQDLQELRKEALITAPKVTFLKANEEDRLEMELKEIEKVTKAAKQCSEMLLKTLPDRSEAGMSVSHVRRFENIHKEDKLIKAIDQVSEAAKEVCDKIFKDIHPNDVPKTLLDGHDLDESKIQLDNIDKLAKRCMRQFRDLSESPHDYDNVFRKETTTATPMSACNLNKNEANGYKHIKDISHSNLTEPASEKGKTKNAILSKESTVIEEIDQIMRECEEQIRGKGSNWRPAPEGQASQVSAGETNILAPSLTHRSSTSDGSGGKSSSPSARCRLSSSITSYNLHSSNDYIKSPSSEFQAPSTDPIKTFSTTSYDVQSTTSNATNCSASTTTNTRSGGTPSPSPSSSLNAQKESQKESSVGISDNDKKVNNVSKDCRRRSPSPSQYNSADELAMIFGRTEETLTKDSGNQVNFPSFTEFCETASTTVCPACVPLVLSSANNNAPTQSAVIKLGLSCCTNTTTNTITKIHTKENVVCLAPLSSHVSYNSNTNSYLSHNHSCKLETITVSDTEAMEEISEGSSSDKMFASKLNVVVEVPKQSHELSNNSITQLESSLSSLEDLSSNPDSGNVSLADFPLTVVTTTNTSTTLQLQTNFNSKYQFTNTYVSEISIKSTEERVEEQREEDLPKLLAEKKLYKNLIKIENEIENKDLDNNEIISLKKQLESLSKDPDHIQEESLYKLKQCGEIDYRNDSVEENTLLDNQLKVKTLLEQNAKSILKSNDYKESSPIKTRKESVVIETPKLQMTIMEEKINYEFNLTPEHERGLKKVKSEVIDDEEEDEILTVNIWPLTQSRDNSENIITTEEQPSTSTSTRAKMMNVMNILGEERPMVNGLTLLEHLVVACTLNSLTNNDLLTMFLVIIGVIIITILSSFG